MKNTFRIITSALLTLFIIYLVNGIFFPNTLDPGNIQKYGLGGLNALGIAIALAIDLTIALICFPLLNILLAEYVFKK